MIGISPLVAGGGGDGQQATPLLQESLIVGTYHRLRIAKKHLLFLPYVIVLRKVRQWIGINTQRALQLRYLWHIPGQGAQQKSR